VPGWSGCARRAGYSATGTASSNRGGRAGSGRLLRQCRLFEWLVGDPGVDARVVRNVPRWLLDPLGPLSLRWSYLPAIAPWARPLYPCGDAEKVRIQARALAPAGRPDPRRPEAAGQRGGAEDLVHRLGHLYVYRSGRKSRKRISSPGRCGAKTGWRSTNSMRLAAPARTCAVARVCPRPLGARNRHTSTVWACAAPARALPALGGEHRAGAAQGFHLKGRPRARRIQTDSAISQPTAALVCAGRLFEALARSPRPIRCRSRRSAANHLMIADPEAMPRIPPPMPTASSWRRHEYGAALCRHRRARRPCGTPRLAACPHSARTGAQDVARPRRLTPGRADLGMDGPSSDLPDSLPVLGPSNASPD